MWPQLYLDCKSGRSFVLWLIFQPRRDREATGSVGLRQGDQSNFSSGSEQFRECRGDSDVLDLVLKNHGGHQTIRTALTYRKLHHCGLSGAPWRRYKKRTGDAVVVIHISTSMYEMRVVDAETV